MTISSIAKSAAAKLPPDVLAHPMPFPDRLDYAEKIVQEAINEALKTPPSDARWRFTTDAGSALLYYGDEFVAKFSGTHKKAMLAVLAANVIMREEIDGFTQHVGAPTFEEAKSVLLRTKVHDEGVIEEQFNTVKRQSGRITELERFIYETNVHCPMDREIGPIGDICDECGFFTQEGHKDDCKVGQILW